MARLWKNDGPEQQQLEDLFRTKEITPNMKPSQVYAKYTDFQEFRPATFRTHWNSTKKKLRHLCKCLVSEV